MHVKPATSGAWRIQDWLQEQLYPGTPAVQLCVPMFLCLFHLCLAVLRNGLDSVTVSVCVDLWSLALAFQK